tara:strand:- start:361 stop:636 length:276 start_codon:yes stop_codon:yes gene_type:complete
MDKLKKRAMKLDSDIIDLKRSTRKGKKWMVIRKDGTKTHFGSYGMSDYTIHKDPTRRDRYRKRHSKILLKDRRPAYTVKGTPAFYSWHILW